MDTKTIIPLFTLMWSCCLNVSASDLLHSASGIFFPDHIEGRFTRAPVKDGITDSKTITVNYQYADGVSIIVKVYPAPKAAAGPTKPDGDASSDASFAFMKEWKALKTRFAAKDDSPAIVSEQRFKTAPQQNGPVGMKITLKGAKSLTDVLLCERNGYFVSFSVTYPANAWMKYGMTYTDVAHFIKWPPKKG